MEAFDVQTVYEFFGDGFGECPHVTERKIQTYKIQQFQLLGRKINSFIRVFHKLRNTKNLENPVT